MGHNRFPFHRGESGYSLMELVIVIALIGILAGLLSRTFLWGIDLFDFLSNRKNTFQSARIGLEMMADDVRQITDKDRILSASGTTFSFLDPDAETVTYQYSGGTLQRNGQVLVEGLSSFSFTYYDSSGNVLATPVSDFSQIWMVRFEMSGTVDNKPFNLRLSVFPRAF